MGNKDYAKKIAVAACIYYTAASFFILFLYWLLAKDLTRGLHPVSLVCILPFAVCFAVANTLYKDSELSTGWRLMLHMIFTVGGAFGFLYLPNRDASQTPSQALTMLLVLLIVYWAIMGTILVIKARMKKVEKNESSYRSVYKNK